MEIIDRRALERLRRIGGPDLLAKLIDLFLDQAPGMVRKAHDHFEAGNHDEVAHSVHSLIATAGNVGARQLQELAAEAQATVRRDEPEQLAHLLPALDGALEEARAELQGEIERWRA